MIHINQFEPGLLSLPLTRDLLAGANLMVHDCVSRITLHGSRGPKGGARPDSDIDLCLIIPADLVRQAARPELLLRTVLAVTLQNWESHVTADLAVVFDKSGCGLSCFDRAAFDPNLCHRTIDCLGLFKTQKGFNGFVSGPAVDCSKMYPLITIWKNQSNCATPHAGG